MSYFTFTPVCAPAGAAAPQATFTPVNCNITLATLCTPVCGQQAAAAPQTILPTLICPQQGAAAPQATFTPVNCNITLATLCTPVCGQQAAAAPQAAANPPTRIGCGTLPTICNPTFMHCTTNVAAAPQAAAPQGLTVFTLCTPVCNTITPVQC